MGITGKKKLSGMSLPVSVKKKKKVRLLKWILTLLQSEEHHGQVAAITRKPARRARPSSTWNLERKDQLLASGAKDST
jgi:hypothetical protein